MSFPLPKRQGISVNTALFDAFCFDLDGTVYVSDIVLPHVLDTMSKLRKANKRVLFISNSPTQSRASAAGKLRKFGIDVQEQEVLTAAYLAAKFMSENDRASTAFIVGEGALHEEFENFGLAQTTDPFESTHVVVGLDRHFTYQKLNDAMLALRNGAKLIVTNPDPACPVPGGLQADTMSIAKAIETAAETKIETMIGKPTAYFAHAMLELLNVPAKSSLIIGDRLETDILLGKTVGMPTCLVLTGAATIQHVEQSAYKPDYIISNLSELIF